MLRHFSVRLFNNKAPTFFHQQFTAGVIHEQRGEYALALKRFRSIVRALRDSTSVEEKLKIADAHAQIASVLAKSSDIIDKHLVVKSLEEALKLNPHHVLANELRDRVLNGCVPGCDWFAKKNTSPRF